MTSSNKDLRAPTEAGVQPQDSAQPEQGGQPQQDAQSPRNLQGMPSEQKKDSTITSGAGISASSAVRASDSKDDEGVYVPSSIDPDRASPIVVVAGKSSPKTKNQADGKSDPSNLNSNLLIVQYSKLGEICDAYDAYLNSEINKLNLGEVEEVCKVVNSGQGWRLINPKADGNLNKEDSDTYLKLVTLVSKINFLNRIKKATDIPTVQKLFYETPIVFEENTDKGFVNDIKKTLSIHLLATQKPLTRSSSGNLSPDRKKTNADRKKSFDTRSDSGIRDFRSIGNSSGPYSTRFNTDPKNILFRTLYSLLIKTTEVDFNQFNTKEERELESIDIKNFPESIKKIFQLIVDANKKFKQIPDKSFTVEGDEIKSHEPSPPNWEQILDQVHRIAVHSFKEGIQQNFKVNGKNISVSVFYDTFTKIKPSHKSRNDAWLDLKRSQQRDNIHKPETKSDSRKLSKKSNSPKEIIGEFARTKILKNENFLPQEKKSISEIFTTLWENVLNKKFKTPVTGAPLSYPDPRIKLNPSRLPRLPTGIRKILELIGNKANENKANENKANPNNSSNQSVLDEIRKIAISRLEIRHGRDELTKLSYLTLATDPEYLPKLGDLNGLSEQNNRFYLLDLLWRLETIKKSSSDKDEIIKIICRALLSDGQKNNSNWQDAKADIIHAMQEALQKNIITRPSKDICNIYKVFMSNPVFIPPKMLAYSSQQDKMKHSKECVAKNVFMSNLINRNKSKESKEDRNKVIEIFNNLWGQVIDGKIQQEGTNIRLPGTYEDQPYEVPKGVAQILTRIAMMAEIEKANDPEGHIEGHSGVNWKNELQHIRQYALLRLLQGNHGYGSSKPSKLNYLSIATDDKYLPRITGMQRSKITQVRKNLIDLVKKLEATRDNSENSKTIIKLIYNDLLRESHGSDMNWETTRMAVNQIRDREITRLDKQSNSCFSRGFFNTNNKPAVGNTLVEVLGRDQENESTTIKQGVPSPHHSRRNSESNPNPSNRPPSPFLGNPEFLNALTSGLVVEEQDGDPNKQNVDSSSSMKRSVSGSLSNSSTMNPSSDTEALPSDTDSNHHVPRSFTFKRDS